MSDCWICKQKAEWKKERLTAARKQAQQQANETGLTMAIVRTSGCDYIIFEATEANGLKIIEYISEANSS